MISTRSAGLLIDTVVCLTLAKWETVSGRFGGYLKKPAEVAGSADARFDLSATTCDVLTRRCVDRRSTGEHRLRQFLFPRSDAVVQVPQDALLWTYPSPEVDGREP